MCFLLLTDQTLILNRVPVGNYLFCQGFLLPLGRSAPSPRTIGNNTLLYFLIPLTPCKVQQLITQSPTNIYFVAWAVGVKSASVQSNSNNTQPKQGDQIQSKQINKLKLIPNQSLSKPAWPTTTQCNPMLDNESRPKAL